MAKIYKIKNTGIDNKWLGQTILQNQYYRIQINELYKWISNEQVFLDISSGLLVINNGSDIIDDLSAMAGWNWLTNTRELPISALDGKKVAVHTSYKPTIENTTYAVWTGAGDNVVTGAIGDGDLLEFDLVPGLSEQSIDVKFDQDNNGRVWIHEGYLKFNNGGVGDYISANLVSEATPLQNVVSLDLIIENDWIKYSTSGAGTGTHGFADPTKIVLVPRIYSKDGDWDYDGTNLLPNMTGTGEYKISTIERNIHRYINKIPCKGDCHTYFSMSSDETSEVLKNYFLRITAYNVSNTTWTATALLEIYRELTSNP